MEVIKSWEEFKDHKETIKGYVEASKSSSKASLLQEGSKTKNIGESIYQTGSLVMVVIKQVFVWFNKSNRLLSFIHTRDGNKKNILLILILPY